MPERTSSPRTEDNGSNVTDIQLKSSAPPRIYVVSDVRLYREGLVSGLGQQVELEVLGAGSSRELLSQISTLQPEVLLLDIAARDSLEIPRRVQ